MNGKLYWKQQLPCLLLNFSCMIGLAIFLRITGNSLDSIVLILMIWLVILAIFFTKRYYNRKVQLDRLLKLAEQMEERYLISEVMEKPERADDQVYYRLLKMAGKSMLEQINAVKQERTDTKSMWNNGCMRSKPPSRP